MVESLWPAPARVGPPRPGALAHYLAVPDAQDPRFLLPRDRSAAVGILRHFRSDGTPAARRRIAALKQVIRVTGGWPLARGRLAVMAPEPSGTETIETHLREILGVDFQLGIHLGPPRANRKPILQVLGTDGEPLAFGKLGVGPLTQRLVRTEAEALRALSRLELPGLRVPELLHEGDWQGSALLLTTPLPLRRARRVGASRPAGGCHGDPGAGRGHHAGTSRGRRPFLADQRERAAALTLADIRGHLLATIASPRRGAEEWELGRWHGDWMVWNMASLDDEVLVWDWERYAAPVPVGWDALHYALRDSLLDQRADSRGGRGPDDARPRAAPAVRGAAGSGRASGPELPRRDRAPLHRGRPTRGRWPDGPGGGLAVAGTPTGMTPRRPTIRLDRTGDVRRGCSGA